MKQEIEQLIKEALENHTLPYEAGAWEAMSKRLDGSPSSPFYRKWWFAASIGTLLVSSATYFTFHTTQHDQFIAKAVKQQPINNAKTVVSTHKAIASTEVQNKTHENAEPEQIIYEKFQEIDGTTVLGSGPDFGPLNILNLSGDDHVFKQYPSPSFEQLNLAKSLCLNEQLVIRNPNDLESITVISPTGKQTTIGAKESVQIPTTESGTIRVISGDHIDEIIVKQIENHLYTDIDPSLLYENGIPTLKFTVTGAENTVHWKTNVPGTEMRNEQFIVHPYNDRNVAVSVETTDKNGCSISDTRTIRIAEDYNLLAPTGFTPNGNDFRTNRFMPYALTERNVGFELTIIDTKNGGILFHTQDASNGWDGIDKRTGEMVPVGSIWAWRVVLKTPNAGEKAEYSSTITRM